MTTKKEQVTQERAERAMESIRRLANDNVAEAVEHALNRAGPMLEAGMIKWHREPKPDSEQYTPSREELKEYLSRIVKETITDSQRTRGYCSTQASSFFVCAMPKDRGASIAFEITWWMGCGFVLTPNALAPNVRKAVLALPRPQPTSPPAE